MSSDEDQIRQLIATWMSASQSGDIDRVLELMTDDVVFLLPGQQSMIGKAAFAAASKPKPGQPAMQFEGTSEIEEIQVLGDWAFLRTKLKVVVTPPGGSPMTRAGFTMSLLNKQNGKWLLARDANLLSPVASGTT